MKYMLLIWANEKGYASLPPADAKRGMEAYLAYTEALKKAGVHVGGERLQNTSAATTVRTLDGKTQVLNGPLHGDERAVRRLFPHRCAGSGRCALVGGSLPGLAAWHRRSPPDLGVSVLERRAGSNS